MNVKQLEIILENDGIYFLSYGGILSQPIIIGMTDALEHVASLNSISMKISNKLLTIFIELSQNMMNYSKNIPKVDLNFDSKGVIIVGYDEKINEYFVYSRNIISTIDKNIIEPRINKILPLDRAELKELYRKLRKEGKEKHDKGAGIGFVEIAKRCDRVEYSFSKINDNTFYFVLKSIISGI